MRENDTYHEDVETPPCSLAHPRRGVAYFEIFKLEVRSLAWRDEEDIGLRSNQHRKTVPLLMSKTREDNGEVGGYQAPSGLVMT
jgi:hypothetical protein